jgi:hypothetical protein
MRTSLHRADEGAGESTHNEAAFRNSAGGQVYVPHDATDAVVVPPPVWAGAAPPLLARHRKRREAEGVLDTADVREGGCKNVGLFIDPVEGVVPRAPARVR